MRILLPLITGIMLSIVDTACKPVARQEPVSNEQSFDAMVVVLKRFLRNKDVPGAKQILAKIIEQPSEQVPHLLQIEANAQTTLREAFEELVGSGKHHDAIKKAIASQRVLIPEAQINAQIMQIQNSANANELIRNMKQLRQVLQPVQKEFWNLERLIGTTHQIDGFFSFNSFFLKQNDRVKKEFNEWASPLLNQIETAVRKSNLLTHRSDSSLDKLSTSNEVLYQWTRIKQALNPTEYHISINKQII